MPWILIGHYLMVDYQLPLPFTALILKWQIWIQAGTMTQSRTS